MIMFGCADIECFASFIFVSIPGHGRTSLSVKFTGFKGLIAFLLILLNIILSYSAHTLIYNKGNDQQDTLLSSALFFSVSVFRLR